VGAAREGFCVVKKFYVLMVIIIALIAYQHWNADEPDSIGGKADRPPQVVMYGTSSCPACKMARAYFYQHDIPYVEHDIEWSSKAKREFRKLGGRGVPLILIGNEKFMGWSAYAVEAALARLKDSTVTQPDPVAVQRTYDISREEKQEESRAEKYILHFRNGRKIEVKNYWEKGDKIQYRRFGGIIGVERKEVVMIESQAGGTSIRYSPVSTQ
jgi:glutaredoxin